MASRSNNETLRLLEKIHNNKDSEFREHRALLDDIYNRHEKYNPSDLLYELRQDGSNTFMNWFRDPIDYDEVVYDVADKMDIKNISDKENFEHNEFLILEEVANRYWDKLSDSEKKEMIKNINLAGDNEAINDTDLIKRIGIVSGNLVGQLIMIFGMNAAKELIIQIVSRALAVQIGARAVAGYAGLLIPGINIIMAGWLVFDISGPAYRKTVPSVITIALLRRIQNYKENDQ